VKKILVVEDDAALLSGLRDNLEYEGYEVLTARDGVAALTVISANKPDLILLDIQLPWLNGLEFCSTLKAERALREIPVILLSGHVSKDDIRKGFEAGCDEYLTKPVDINRLLRTLKYMLQP
jgi:DNA-binding response OmpR family regulator